MCERLKGGDDRPSVLGKRRNLRHATEIIDLDGPSHREARDPFPERRVVHVEMKKDANEEARTKAADKEKQEPKGKKSSLRSKEEAGGASRVQVGYFLSLPPPLTLWNSKMRQGSYSYTCERHEQQP